MIGVTSNSENAETRTNRSRRFAGEGGAYVGSGARSWTLDCSDLTLQVDPSQGRLFYRLKEVGGFAGYQPDTVISFFKEMLTIIVADKASCLIVRLEAKFFSQEAKFDIGLVPELSISTIPRLALS